MRRGEQSGQAVVELLGMVPLVVVSCLILVQGILLAGVALHVDRSAHAASLADAHGSSASAAARSAIPDWARGRILVKKTARTVAVTVRPKGIVPGLGRLMTMRSRYERPEW